MFLRLAIAALWVIFIIYWWVSAIGNKKYVASSKRRGLRIRIVFAIVIWLAFLDPHLRYFVMHHVLTTNPALRLLGVILCAAGIGFAIWARVHIGRNWGVPMSMREGHELVTTGPYRFVRHPIYSGLLLAMLGSELAVGAWSLVMLVYCGVYFFISAKLEEGTMMQQFPGQYAEYRRRTRGMILPRF